MRVESGEWRVELETVLKAVDRCSVIFSANACENCPFHERFEAQGWYTCAGMLRRDMRRLMEAEAPRLLTAEEIKALKDGKIVWYETHMTEGDFITPMVANGRGYIGNADMGVNVMYLDHNERVWNGEPTEEQRKATAWE